MSAPDHTSTTELTTDSAALAGELFAPGVGAQAGPPTTPAAGTGSAGQATPGAHSHGGPARTGSPAQRLTSTHPHAAGRAVHLDRPRRLRRAHGAGGDLALHADEAHARTARRRALRRAPDLGHR